MTLIQYVVPWLYSTKHLKKRGPSDDTRSFVCYFLLDEHPRMFNGPSDSYNFLELGILEKVEINQRVRILTFYF